MKNHLGIIKLASLFAVVALAAPAYGQSLYSQNFDVDDTANWTINNGPSDEAHDFFFDYSTLGIPSAPNSGGSTRGMQLKANLTSNIFGGMSVSPNGQSFTGNYTLAFDVWSNYVGRAADGIGNIALSSGSSMLSEFGIMTAGTSAQWPGGVTDGVWFGAVSDTSSTAYRIYSNDRPISYRGTVDFDDVNAPYDPVIDGRANYYAKGPNNLTTRSNNPNSATRPAGQLYLDTFPIVTVPAAQTAIPGLATTQYGSSPVAGVFGFAWHEVEITKVGNVVTWKVDGAVLGDVDTTNFATQPAGSNIFFGHSDININSGTDPNYQIVQFTLVDNVKVSAIPTNDADFNDDGKVNAADLSLWSGTFGGAATGTTGDANGDSKADGADFLIWQQQYKDTAGVGSVPEPATWCSAVVAALILATVAAPGRRAALQRVAR